MVDPRDKLLLSPDEAAGLLGIGRSNVFGLLRTGEIDSFRIGVSRKIPRDALDAFIASRRAAAPSGTPSAA